MVFDDKEICKAKVVGKKLNWFVLLIHWYFHFLLTFVCLRLVFNKALDAIVIKKKNKKLIKEIKNS